MILRFGKSHSPLRSFCIFHDETPIHLLSSCSEVISLWIEIKLYRINTFIKNFNTVNTY